MTSSERSLIAVVSALMLSTAFASSAFRAQRIGLVVVASILAVVAATASKSLVSIGGLPQRRVALIVVPLAVGLFILQIVRHFPTDSTFESFVGWVGCAAVVLLAAFYAFGRGGTVVWLSLIVVYGVLMASMILFTLRDTPAIDVMIFQQDGAAALLRLQNPFVLTFPDIYPPDASAFFYADGLSVNGVLQFGYPYFPLGLVAVAPFEWFADFRFAHLAAILTSAVLISRMSSRPVARLAALVLLFASPSVYLVRLGFMDPLVLLTVVVVTLLAVRGSKAVSAASGLIYAMKQYTAFLLIPSLLLLERPWRTRAVVRHFASAAFVFLLVTLPFALWDFGAFWWSTIELQFVQPFRSDSLALPALFPGVWDGLSPLISVGGPVLVVLVVSIWVAMKTPTGAQGFALGAAAVLIVGFVTSKQAFANYYLVVIGALCAGAAADPSWEESELVDDRFDQRLALE